MPLPTVDTAAFRRACSRFPTGIAVATVIGTDGAPHGLTVNSFTSVSLSPPLVLICVDHSSVVLAHFRASDSFGVNILREDQRDVSARFARKGHDRFGGVKWIAGKIGVPLLPDALAQLECKVTQTVEAGDHTILIGRVARAESHDGRPLVYFNSSYRELG
jgi:flavin reductase (DIM6/NTAB) family NADH-FMN oxidoreductase RutF